jgi:hypothetical protein
MPQPGQVRTKRLPDGTLVRVQLTDSSTGYVVVNSQTGRTLTRQVFTSKESAEVVAERWRKTGKPAIVKPAPGKGTK